jgi:YVTN family beta-propeller protein
MKLRISRLIAAFACILGSAQSLAQNAYITNFDATGTVSVINTATNKVTAAIPVGGFPFGVAVSPDGRRVYVANEGPPSQTVSVIDTATNKVIANIGTRGSVGIAASQDGRRVYAANTGDQTVSVIDATTNTLIANVPVGLFPYGVAVTPDSRKVYITDCTSQCGSSAPAVVAVGRGDARGDSRYPHRR